MKKPTKSNYCGIENVYFIYHGEWSDPEIEYDGYRINVHDLEDGFFIDYEMEIEENRIPADMTFEQYMKANENDVIEVLKDAIY